MARGARRAGAMRLETLAHRSEMSVLHRGRGLEPGHVRRRRRRRRAEQHFHDPLAAQHRRRAIRVRGHHQDAALAEQPAAEVVRELDATEAAADDAGDLVVLRQPLVDERVIRRQQVEHVRVARGRCCRRRAPSRGASTRRARGRTAGRAARRGSSPRARTDAATAWRSASTARRPADRPACGASAVRAPRAGAGGARAPTRAAPRPVRCSRGSTTAAWRARDRRSRSRGRVRRRQAAARDGRRSSDSPASPAARCGCRHRTSASLRASRVELEQSLEILRAERTAVRLLAQAPDDARRAGELVGRRARLAAEDCAGGPASPRRRVAAKGPVMFRCWRCGTCRSLRRADRIGERELERRHEIVDQPGELGQEGGRDALRSGLDEDQPGAEVQSARARFRHARRQIEQRRALAVDRDLDLLVAAPAADHPAVGGGLHADVEHVITVRRHVVDDGDAAAGALRARHRPAASATSCRARCR